MKNLLSLFFYVALPVFCLGQTLSSTRSANWKQAGLREVPTVYTDTITFLGDATGATDVSSQLQNILDNLSQPTLVQFPAGTFLFQQQISMPSQVLIKGLGADATTFNFDLGGASQSCFFTQGSRIPADFDKTIASVSKGDFTLTQTAPIYGGLAVGDYIQLIQDDTRLTNNQTKYTGQISKIASLTATTITLESAVRLNYAALYNPRFAHINQPKKEVGFECFTINRLDAVSNTSSINEVAKFRFDYSVNCWIKGVRSFKCNGAHVRMAQCANMLVAGNYFNDAFAYGTGGQAYGINLLLATSECRIENNIFENLRHSMLVHYGANANVFAYNYSFNTKDEFGPGSEDLVCHGNYPYLNLFEGNVAEWASVDNAAGRNGPYNTFFRNRLTRVNKTVVFFTQSVNGFWISNAASDSQNVLGNHTPGAPGQLQATGHQIEFNSWQSSSGSLEQSLGYDQKPDFFGQSTAWGSIGYPNFSVSTNPAADRVSSSNLFLTSCGTNTLTNGSWSAGTPGASGSEQLDLVVDTGEQWQLSSLVKARSLTLRPTATVDFQVTPNFTDSVYLEADTLLGYSMAIGNPGAPVVYEQIIKEPGWHYLASPVSGAQVNQLGQELVLNFSSQGPACNIYTWQPNSPVAQWQAVNAGTQNLDQTALNLYVADNFVPSGAGINQDGKLPVKIRFRGSANHGSTPGPVLGLGASSHTTGIDAVGWNLIPNPYSSSIDLNAVFSSLPAGYQPAAHIWNAATQTFEVRTKNLLMPGNPAAIAPAQAFFVKLDPGASPGAGFYDFTESDRTLSKSPVFRKTQNYRATLVLESAQGAQQLHLNFGAEGKWQMTGQDVSRFNLPGAQPKIGQWGVLKNQSGKERLLALANYPPPVAGMQLPLRFSLPASATYGFKADALELPEGLALFLWDKETGFRYGLSQQESAVLSLLENPDAGRFALVVAEAVVRDVSQASSFYVKQGRLYAHYPLTGIGSAQLALRDLQGRLIFETEVFSPAGIKGWPLPNLASGIYLIHEQINGKSKTQKVLLP
jgi:hypothetical protein